MSTLKRFIEAQDKDYKTALSEIKMGRKRSHWMWFIFPQMNGLGHSEISKYYAIKDIREAQEFINHPVLGKRLVEICSALYNLTGNDANEIFGSPDDLKLKSSMTLFSLLPNSDPIFEGLLKKFFNGQKDRKTMNLIEQNR